MSNVQKNKCLKFEANVFNRTKCQTCLKSKDTHSAEALEKSKQARKVSKCGYLFVAPDTLDFSSVADRTRRWQRRFFILYDDGELTYSIDDNPTTVPQGVLDMNSCLDIEDAEQQTHHQFSIVVQVPNQAACYIKGTSKEEIKRWKELMLMFSGTLKTKLSRRATVKEDPQAMLPANLQRVPRSPSPVLQTHVPSPEIASGVLGTNYSEEVCVNGKNTNETDERKMAKSLNLLQPSLTPTQPASSRLSHLSEDLKYSKKGYLLKQRCTEDNEWTKHLFVLVGKELKYYKNEHAKELDVKDGVVHLHDAYEVQEHNVKRNHGFIIKKASGDVVLSATTMTIRNNWIQALQAALSGVTALSRFTEDRVSTGPWKSTNRPSQIAQESSHLADEVISQLSSSQESLTASQDDLSRSGAQDCLQRGRIARRRRQINRNISSPWPNSMKQENHTEPLSKSATDFTATPPEPSPGTTLSPAGHTSLTRKGSNRSSLSERILADYDRRELEMVIQQPVSLQEYRLLQQSAALSAPTAPRPVVPDAVVEPAVVVTEAPKVEKAPPPSTPPSTLDLENKDMAPSQVEALMQQRAKSRKSLLLETEISPSTKTNIELNKPEEVVSLQKEELKKAETKKEELMKAETKKEDLSPMKQIEEQFPGVTMRRRGPVDQLDTTASVDTDSDLWGQILKVIPAQPSGVVHQPDEFIEKKWQESDFESSISSCEDLDPKVERQRANRSGTNASGETTLNSILETEVETLKSKLESTEEQLQNIVLEKIELETQLRSQTSISDYHCDLENDQQRYMNQIHHLQDQLDDVTKHYQTALEEQDNRLELAKVQVQSLRSQLQESKAAQISQQDRIGSLTTQLELKDREQIETKTELMAKQRKVDQMDKEMVELQEQIDALRTHQTDTARTDMIGRLKEELEDLKEEIDDLKEENETLTQRLTESYDAFDQKKKELETSQREIARHKHKQTAVNEEIAEMKGKKDQLATENDQLRAERSRLLQEVEGLKAKVKTLQAELQESGSVMNEQMEQLNKFINKSQDTSSKSLKLSEVESELEETQSLYRDLQKEAKRLRSELDEHTREAHVWQDKYIDKCDEWEKLKELLAKETNREDLRVQVARLQDDVSQERENTQRLKEEVVNKEREKEELERQGQLNLKRLHELEEKLDDTVTQLKAIKDEKDGNEEDSEELKNKYQGTLQELKTAQQDLRAAEKIRTQLELDNVELSRQLKNTPSNDESTTKLTELKAELEAARRRIHRLSLTRKEGSDPDLNSTSLQSEVIDLKQQLNVANEKLKQAQEELLQQNCLVIDLQQLKVKETRLHKENAALRQQLELGQQGGEAGEEALGCLGEIELRLQQVVSTLEDCRDKLHDLLAQVERSPGQSEVKEKLKKLLQDLDGSVSDTEVGGRLASDVDERRLFAEQLAVEAVLLMEVARHLKVENGQQNTEVTVALVEGVVAQLAIYQQTLEGLKRVLHQSNSTQRTTPPNCVYLANLLRRKLLLGAELREALQELPKNFGGSDSLPPHELGEVEGVVQRGVVDTQLVKSSQLLPRVLVHCDVAGLQQCLQQAKNNQAADGSSQAAAGLIHQAKESVRERFTALTCSAEPLVQQCIDETALLLVRQAVWTLLGSGSNSDQITEDDVLKEMNWTLHQTALIQTINKLVPSDSVDGSLLYLQRAAGALCDQLYNSVKTQVRKQSQNLIAQCCKEPPAVADLARRRSELFIALGHTTATSALIACQLKQMDVSEPSGGVGDGKAIKLDLQRNDSGVVAMSHSLPTSPAEFAHQFQLVPFLEEEAGVKLGVVKHLEPLLSVEAILEKVGKISQGLGGVNARLEGESLGYTLDSFSARVWKEAVAQAQISYVANALRLSYQTQVDELKSQVARLESEMSVIRNDMESSKELSKESASVIANQWRAELRRKEQQHLNEIQALHQSYQIRLSALEEDVNSLEEELDREQEDRLKEVAELQKTVEMLEEELFRYRDSMEELETDFDKEVRRYQAQIHSLQSELMAAPTAKELESLEEEVLRLTTLLEEEQDRHLTEINALREEAGGEDGEVEAIYQVKVRQLEASVEQVRETYEQQLKAAREIQEEQVGLMKEVHQQQMDELRKQLEEKGDASAYRKAISEMDKMQVQFDKRFAEMSHAHQKALAEQRHTHKKACEAMRKDKNKALAEETMATHAALEVMRKTHEDELQKERNKFLDTLAKTYSQSDLESINSQRNEREGLLKAQLAQVMDQYSQQCSLSSELQEKLNRATHTASESEHRCKDLQHRVTELNSRIHHDLDRLNRELHRSHSSTTSPESKDPNQNLLKLKEFEIGQLKNELEALKAGTKDYDALRSRVRDLEQQVDDCGRLQRSGDHKSRVVSHQDGQVKQTEPTSNNGQQDRKGSDDTSVTTKNSSRQLPQLPSDVQGVKKSLWRQRQPERARSNPGPVARLLASQAAMDSTSGVNKELVGVDIGENL